MSGSILSLPSGALLPTPHDTGDAAALAAAKAALAAGGLMQIGPGLEALVLGAGWGNICLARITNNGILALSRFHMADGDDPTKLLKWLVSGITTGTIRTVTVGDWSGFLPLPVDEGISGRFLRSGGAGVQPTWAAVTLTNALLDGANHSDTVARAVARGMLIVGNSTPAWDRLVIGAANTLLKSDGLDPSWGTVNLLSAFHADTLGASPVRGDLVVANATPAWARFARGAADTFLGSDGTDLQWRTAAAIAALLEHNALFHLKPFQATGVSMANSSAQLVTTGGQFANVRVGDRINLDDANYPSSVYGMKVNALIDSNNITMDRTNTGGAVSGAVASVFPGDHWNHTLMQGLLSSGGYGTFDEGANPGGTIPEVFGSFDCVGYAHAGTQRWGFEGASTTLNPNGFNWKKRGSSARTFIHVQNITANRVISVPDLSGIFMLTGGAQDVTDKTLIGNNEIQMENVAGNVNGSHLADFGNPTKKLYLNLSGITAGQNRLATWQDRSGTVAYIDDALVGSYAPGSFTLANGQYLNHVKQLRLTTTQRATLEGDARLVIAN